MKVLYVINDIEYFLAHRVKLARGIIAQGHQVIVAAGNHWGEANPDDMEGLEYILFDIDRQAFSLTGDIKLMRTFSSIIKEHRPDVVHTITIKPNLYVAMVAIFMLPTKIAKATRFIMTFAGLGKVFEETGGFWQIARRSLVEKTLKFASVRLDTMATFENIRDRDLFVEKGVFGRDQCLAVMGAGIDLDIYQARQRTGRLRLLLASRLINEKGVDTYLAVAERFRDLGVDVDFVLAGGIIESNPDAVDPQLVAKAERSGAVIYKQFVQPADMPALLAEVDIVCLPTRLQEGLPRILLEAAASGCAMIASDQMACRTIVHPRETGWLLEQPDADSLFNAITAAMDNVEETRQMGQRARELVCGLPVADAQIQEQFLDLYRRSGHDG